MKLLTELYYFPNIDYFSNIFKCEDIVLEAHSNYQKQTFRNRCYILAANGVQMLTVPVKKSGNVTYKEIKIDYAENWQKKHWRSIASAYGKAPFFEYYSDYLRALFEKKYDFLFDLNYDILILCLKLLQENKEIGFTDLYTIENNNDVNGVIDNRDNIISAKDQHFKILDVQYQQMFGKEFVGNLSIIDLLFCEGNNSRLLLR
jgi:hypothetical protein